jgi:hypothetical protein
VQNILSFRKTLFVAEATIFQKHVFPIFFRQLPFQDRVAQRLEALTFGLNKRNR